MIIKLLMINLSLPPSLPLSPARSLSLSPPPSLSPSLLPHRFIVIGGLTPLLMHIGYSIDWKQIIIITWGGLRGAVGLALALVVAQTPEIPLGTIGSKVL